MAFKISAHTWILGHGPNKECEYKEYLRAKYVFSEAQERYLYSTLKFESLFTSHIRYLLLSKHVRRFIPIVWAQGWQKGGRWALAHELLTQHPASSPEAPAPQDAGTRAFTIEAKVGALEISTDF